MLPSIVPWRQRIPSTFSRFGEDMEELMERFFDQAGNGWNVGDFNPSVNLAETEKGFEITAELPGLKPEEVNVEIREGNLWISGEKTEEKEEKGKTFHKIERRTGEFRRVIPFTVPVNEGKVDAVFEHGILKITVPKSEEVKTTKIKVKG